MPRLETPLTKRDIVISAVWAPPNLELVKLWPSSELREVLRRKWRYGSRQHNRKTGASPAWENAVRTLETD